MEWHESLTERATSANLTIGIVGLGYVGLPTAIGFFDAGFQIWGIDISKNIVDTILRGENPTGDPNLDSLIPKNNPTRWNITTSCREAIPHCDIILVTVPTPITIDLKPDLSYIEKAGYDIFSVIEKGSRKIVVLESTVYPGVTAQIWKPILEELNLKEGKDVEIAYCPERFNPGDEKHGVRQVARVIGCSNPNVGEVLVNLYKNLTTGDVRFVGKIEVAEASKVIENIQRDMNIALVNELARILPEIGIDVEEVLSAAATKWNFHRYTPGIGVGGHCIPVDPYYLIQKASDIGVPAELITAARAVNRSMPTHVGQIVTELLWKAGVQPKDSKVLLLGWSYKPNVGDPRETPALLISQFLMAKGINVAVWDPYIASETLPQGVKGLDSLEQVNGYDLAILITAHKECLEIDWSNLAKQMRHRIVYDGRRVLDLDKLSSIGWQTHAIGRP